MRDNEIAFLGKITAGATHEINNVLAIIKESSGLMDDLISLCEETPFPYIDKFTSALAAIEEQVKRGVVVTRNLNTLAHDTDEPVVQTDLNRVIEQILFLLERFARKRNIAMKFHSEDQQVFLTINPILFQMIISELLECCWGSIPLGGNLTVESRRDEKGVSVTIFLEGEISHKENLVRSALLSDKWDDMEVMVKELGGEIAYDQSSFCFTLTLAGLESTL